MIKNCHVDDAIEQINQSEDGAHYLIIYPELRTLRELYTKYIKTQLEQESKTVLMLPHYETADSFRKVLSDHGFPAANNTSSSIDMKKYEDYLIVVDSLKAHFGTRNHAEFVNDQVKRAQNGVLVIADAGPFFHLNKTDKLMEHELSMPSQFDANLKRFCVFHKQDFNNLTEEQRRKLVNHHGQVLIVKDK